MYRTLYFALIPALLINPAFAQRNRIHGAADDGRRVRLTGHVHPKANAADETGTVDAAEPLRGLTIVLKPSAEQETALDKLLAEQQDPASVNYHHWLSPEEFAERFGASQSDIAKMSDWLEQQGLRVTAVSRARNQISFEGTAGVVSRAFRTEFHRYNVNGELHFANSTEPEVPMPMAGLVRGIKGLNDFRMNPRLRKLDTAVTPNYTSGSGNHYLAPEDLGAIYNVKPLWAAGYDGAGQKIVVAGQTRVDMSDIQTFRTRFQLPANDPEALLVPHTRDPGTVSGDMEEADLDLQWAGAVAPKANIVYVYSYDVMDAVQYAVDQNIAPVISVSYGLCEPLTARSDALLMQTWARQGNAQGITWVNAAGDSGGADCVYGRNTRGAGLAVDVPASIPEVTGVGGTTLTEGSGQYWNSSNAANGSSALTYIPETVWNDSTSGNPASGGGGSSTYFARPSWQTGSGVFGETARNVPDVSLASSAEHNGYMVYNKGKVLVFGGTSAAAPSLAGVLALLNQHLVSTGAQSTPGLGNLNPGLYALAQTTPSAFHDVTAGNNIVTVACTGRARNCSGGSFGYEAGPGYDRASGLGSIDAYSLVLAWRKSALSSRARQQVTLTVNVAANGEVTGTVAGANGVAPGGTVTVSAGDAVLGTASLTAAGEQATFSLTLDPTSSGAGTTITVRYAGDDTYESAGTVVQAPSN